ncbi:helix-turn-helix domain-containing protein [Parahaliea sp. F7430]|uniref:Helix-turn-helix domain-containing protein n=1 Tax=Sediminihaliea albiluteola TaxID=2758564 RepID=A0A7W2TU73_9GAMM|nr:helix-turn-helix domain-containing protein [Sediminihaliea albiluteola]MBA6411958.1 helix-turn-helix domain-containing protein [Sediminihaliea albiluteola]
MLTAAALLYPDALATSVTLPMEILQAASQLASVSCRGQTQLRFLLAGPDLEPIRLASGVELQPSISFDQLPPLDLLLLPAIWRNPLPTIRSAEPWLPLLADIASRGTRICSVGTASTLLAEAGLLDHQPATTHWNFFERFARRYPLVQLKTRHLITQSDNIYCAGSVNSIADLMVHLVEIWFGPRISRAVEQQFSPEIRQSFRAAAYQNTQSNTHHDETVLQAQQAIQEQMATGINFPQLAQRLQISTRTLNRRFREATGNSPQDYLTSLRIATAKDLLRRSNLSVGEVSWQVGLQDASYFSQLFRRHTGVSPMRYREAARGKLFDPQETSKASL